jgi:sporulation protein YlmC with PRC-barrel domain
LTGVTTSPTRVFVGRLAGLQVFDPAGDQVGRVRDLVAVVRPGQLPPRIVGLVVEVFGRRAIFIPMTRVTSIDSGQIITTGVVNMRRFEQRPSETLVVGEMLDRTVRIKESGAGARPTWSSGATSRGSTPRRARARPTSSRRWRR